MVGLEMAGYVQELTEFCFILPGHLGAVQSFLLLIIINNHREISTEQL